VTAGSANNNLNTSFAAAIKFHNDSQIANFSELQGVSYISDNLEGRNRAIELIQEIRIVQVEGGEQASPQIWTCSAMLHEM
jgi:HD superfamily phosphohydrolase YqeK